MQSARVFFFVCAGLFLLALSYHLGAGNARAQAPGNPIAAAFVTSTKCVAIGSNGDVYTNPDGNADGAWALVGNVFAGATPTRQETLGGLKARYR